MQILKLQQLLDSQPIFCIADLQSQIAIENDHHANVISQLELEMETCANLAAEAYDR